MEEQQKKKRGRPPGSKTKLRDEVEVIASRCKKCGSTERTPYHNHQSMNIEGDINGIAYNKVSWKNTECKGCGQSRVDRFYELVSKEDPIEESDQTLIDEDESNSESIFDDCNEEESSEDLIHDSGTNPIEDL